MKFEIKNRFTNETQFVAEIAADENTPLSIKIGLAVKWAFETNADIRGTEVRGAYLRDANLCDADITGASLSGANLHYANLSGAHLSGVDFRDANLCDADLSGADISGANLSDANLSGANLSGAHLRGANIRDAHLCDANFRGAHLSDSNLRGANLRGANLSGAHLSDAELRSFKVDLWMTLTQNKTEVLGLVAAMREGRIDGSVYSGDCACLKGTLANVKGVSVNDYEQDASQPAEQWFLMIKKGDKPDDESGGGFALKTALDWTLEWCALNEILVGVETK